MSDRDLLAALDACRPGESIADDPALADAAHRLETDEAARRLLERVRQADCRLEAALRAVEPPVGLADRLLARLAVVASASATAPTSAEGTADGEERASGRSVAATATVSGARRSGFGDRRWRRRAFLGGGVAAVAASVMLAIHYWPQPADPWTAEQVLDAAIGLYTRGERNGGLPLAEAPEGYAPSRDLIDLPANTRWRRIADALAGGDAIAYDIELAPGGTRAMLLVVSAAAEVTGLPDYPPPMPATPTTQGVCAAAWRENDLVYVLVVEGGPREYERFLRTNHGPFAAVGGDGRCVFIGARREA